MFQGHQGHFDLDAAMRSVKGTARSMGVEIAG